MQPPRRRRFVRLEFRDWVVFNHEGITIASKKASGLGRFVFLACVLVLLKSVSALSSDNMLIAVSAYNSL